jgi:F-type H+-transporting ATPase subunit b
VNNPLTTVDPGLYIWTIATFLVLVLLLRMFAWKPLLGALDRREKLIAGAVDDAHKAKAEFDRARQEASQVVVQARREADAILVRTRADAERLRAEAHQKAAEEAAGIVRNGERRIQQETTKAIQQIRREAVDLSMAIASKLIRHNITKEDNEQLIKEMVDQLDETRH